MSKTILNFDDSEVKKVYFTTLNVQLILTIRILKNTDI